VLVETLNPAQSDTIRTINVRSKTEGYACTMFSRCCFSFFRSLIRLPPQQKVMWSDEFLCLLVPVFVTLVVVSQKGKVRFVWNLCQMSLSSFQRSRSKFKVKTAVLKLFHL